jgi:hypothetical protein
MSGFEENIDYIFTKLESLAQVLEMPEKWNVEA